MTNYQTARRIDRRADGQSNWQRRGASSRTAAISQMAQLLLLALQKPLTLLPLTLLPLLLLLLWRPLPLTTRELWTFIWACLLHLLPQWIASRHPPPPPFSRCPLSNKLSAFGFVVVVVFIFVALVRDFAQCGTVATAEVCLAQQRLTHLTSDRRVQLCLTVAAKRHNTH